MSQMGQAGPSYLDRYKRFTFAYWETHIGVAKRAFASIVENIKAGEGLVLVVMGEIASGKTLTAHYLAEALHRKGCRAPAVFDDPYFETVDWEDSTPWGRRHATMERINRWSHMARTPAIVTITLQSPILNHPVMRDAIIRAPRAEMFIASMVWHVSWDRETSVSTLTQHKNRYGKLHKPLKIRFNFRDFTKRPDESNYALLGRSVMRELRR